MLIENVESEDVDINHLEIPLQKKLLGIENYFAENKKTKYNLKNLISEHSDNLEDIKSDEIKLIELDNNIFESEIKKQNAHQNQDFSNNLNINKGYFIDLNPTKKYKTPDKNHINIKNNNNKYVNIKTVNTETNLQTQQETEQKLSKNIDNKNNKKI